MSSFAKFIVNNADGSINIDSTKQKYDSACTDAYHKARDAFEQKLATDYQTALASFETDLQKHTTIHNRWDELSLTYILASFEKFASDKGTIVKPYFKCDRCKEETIITEDEVEVFNQKKDSHGGIASPVTTCGCLLRNRLFEPAFDFLY